MLQAEPQNALRSTTPTLLATQPFDSFNDDLVWILDKLVARTGGALGIFSGHVAGEETPKILAIALSGAASLGEPEYSESEMALYSGIVAHASPPFGFERRRRSDDTPAITQRAWQAKEAWPVEYNLLELSFSPTENVTVVATVSRAKEAGSFDSRSQLEAMKLYPVLSRYVRLWWLHRMERRRANTLSAALDMSDMGVMLLDRSGKLLFANHRAKHLLQRREGLRLQSKSLIAEQEGEGVRFQAAVQHAIHRNLSGRSAGEKLQRVPIMPISRGHARRPLIVSVIGVDRMAVDAQDPAVMVYALDPDQEFEHLLAPICAIYKLTAAESRLVFLLVRGMRISEAAQQMRIQVETARSYLKQVFAKTMTHRQTDLVRVMLTSAMRTSGELDLGLL